jgi:hypothetical protein
MLEKVLRWLWWHDHHCPTCHNDYSHWMPLCLNYLDDDLICPRCTDFMDYFA